MLSSIHVVCFFTSYCIALALEISRLFFRLPVRLIVMIGFAGLGLGLHTLYLWQRAAAGAMPLASWHDWFLIASWIMAAAYLGLVASRPQSNVGLFILPVVLILTAVAWAYPPGNSFTRDRAVQMWGTAHGLMLLLGTVAVSFGFAAGLMYLVQSWRLKHRGSPPAGLKLPSLEWLQKINKQSLLYSSCFIALGLIAGIVLNAAEARGRGPGLPWSDSVVISSAVLLVWLLAATIFEWLYKPAQQGRKVAYLTVASFLFLALVMALLLSGGSEHGRGRATERGEETEDGGQKSEVRGQKRLGIAFGYSVLSTQYSVGGPRSFPVFPRLPTPHSRSPIPFSAEASA